MKKMVFFKFLRPFLKRYWKVIFAVVYLIWPIEIIPDVFIPLGYTDDILILAFALVSYYFDKKKMDNLKKDAKSDDPETFFGKEGNEIVEGELVD